LYRSIFHPGNDGAVEAKNVLVVVEEAAGVVAGLIIRNDLDLVRRKGNTNLKSLKKIRIGTRTRIETKTRTEAVERTRKNPN